MIRGKVILRHFDGERCSNTVLKNAYFKLVCSHDRQGINHSGMIDTSKITVRIFTEKKLAAECGDSLSIGNACHGTNNIEFVICEISDNRVGNNPHYRIVGERQGRLC